MTDAVDGSIVTLLDIKEPSTGPVNGYYTVTLSGLSVKAGESVVVLHYTGTEWEKLTVTSVTAGSVTFKTKSFSPFAIIKAEADKEAAFGMYNPATKKFTDMTALNNLTKTVIGNAEEGLNAGKMKLSGANGAAVTVLAGDAKSRSRNLSRTMSLRRTPEQ